MQQRSPLSYAAATKQSPTCTAAAAAGAVAKQPSSHTAAAAAAAKHHHLRQRTSHGQKQQPAPPKGTTPKPVRSQHTPHKRVAISPGTATNSTSPTRSMPPPRTTGHSAKKAPSAPSSEILQACAQAAQRASAPDFSSAQTDGQIDQSTNQ